MLRCFISCRHICHLTLEKTVACNLPSSKRNMPRECREIQIPTEYGHMAAKDWGPVNGELILALHGWQDNAGTFDRIVPFLPSSFRVIAVDLPGHGLSTHKPPGSCYHFMESLLDLRLVADFLGKRPFILLGHSMGAGISLMYAATFPEDVKAVISLDSLKPTTVTKDEMPTRTASSIRQRLMLSKRLHQAPPVYSKEEALERLHKAMAGSVTVESARVLLERSVREVDRGVVFNRDLRLQVETIQKMDHEAVKSFLSHLKCQLLIVKSKSGNIGLQESLRPVAEDYKAMFSKNSERFVFVEVDGTHHAHLNDADTVARLINAFLEGLEFKMNPCQDGFQVSNRTQSKQPDFWD